MKTINRTIVAALVVSADGQYLLVRQADEAWRPYPGLWGLPGGGVDEGEDHRTALDRELREELSVDISPYPAELVCESEGEAEKTSRSTGERVHLKLKFYDYRVVINNKLSSEIEIKLDPEHSAYRWFSPDEVKGLALTPPSVKLFTQLGYI